jgi:predicted ATPase
VAHMPLGCTLYLLGELTSARTHLEQTIALYDPQKHPRPTTGTADYRVNCLSFAALTLWCLGYPDQAQKRSQEALTLAEGLSHPYSVAYALAFAATFDLLRREEQLARERAEAVITLSTEQGLPQFLAFGTFSRGGALAEQGQVEEGIAQIQQSLAALRATGTENQRTGNLARLAAAYGRVGRIEEGLTLLAEALALVNKTGDRVSEAELYRLRGELTLTQSSVQSLESSVQKEAEECFWKAIEIARKQQAKSWELRASTSLARLWQQQGKLKEAHDLLSDVYGWFREGFDTKDLQEAKVLLAELQGATTEETR